MESPQEPQQQEQHPGNEQHGQKKEQRKDQQQVEAMEQEEQQEQKEEQQKEQHQELEKRERDSHRSSTRSGFRRLVCRQPSVIGGEMLKESELVPLDPDDVEREKRLEELRQRNAIFWKKMFVESGVREEEQKPEGSVWKQRLTIAAVIVVVAAGISQAIYRAYVDVNFGFKYIDVKDTERLKEVMFGGNPWIVLCRWAERKSNVPEILNSHRRELTKFGNLGSVDCSGVLFVWGTCCAAELPSGKTFSERFRIPSSTDVIIVTNGKTPRALNAWTFKTWENLSFFLQRSTRVDVNKIEDNVNFVKSCLYPPGARCIAFFRKGGFSAEGRKSVASALAEKGATRKLKAITLDSAKYQITRVEIPTEPAYLTKVACFGNISPPPPPEMKKSNDVSNNTFIFSLYEGDFTDTPSLSAFAEKCIHSKEGDEGFSLLPQVPVLKRKPSSSSSSSR